MKKSPATVKGGAKAPCSARFRGLSSVEENDSAGELNACEKISGELVVSCGDGAKVLEFIEEALVPGVMRNQ